MIDVTEHYGLDATGQTDNAAPLAGMANDIAAMVKRGNQLPRLSFSEGIYEFSSWPDLAWDHIEIVADGAVTLKHTGAGDAVVFNAGGPPPSQGTRGRGSYVYFDNFTIAANPNTKHALALTCVHRSYICARITGTPTNSGFAIYFSVLTELDNPIMEGQAKPTCTGIMIDQFNGFQTTACRINNPVIGGCNVGIHMRNAGGCAIHDGAVQSCNTGTQIDVGGANRFMGTWFEGNAVDAVTGSGAHDNTLWLTTPGAFKGNLQGWNNQHRALL